VAWASASTMTANAPRWQTDPEAIYIEGEAGLYSCRCKWHPDGMRRAIRSPKSLFERCEASRKLANARSKRWLQTA